MTGNPGPTQIIYSDHWPYDSEERMLADRDGTLEPTATEAARVFAFQKAWDASTVTIPEGRKVILATTFERKDTN